MKDLGTFQSRAAEINARMNASQAKRDTQFAWLITLHIVFIALLFGSLIQWNEQMAEQAIVNQEQIAWK